MRESAFYLIHLMSCALNDVQPCSLPEGASWDEVYALAEFNSVEGLAWTSARRVRDVPADMLKEWGATADMTLYRCVSYGIEREAVLAALADRGLSWLPLKGALLVDLYPSPHMRSMADNDILYGFVEEDPAGGFRIAGATEADRERTTARAVRMAVEVMEARGYRTISKTAGNHESFVKNPHFNFELHRRLVSPSSPQAAYYHNPWQRAVPVRLDSNAAEGEASDAGRGGRGREYRFSDDDFYLHLVSHAFKHYDASGCGIRFLVDQLVFLRARGKGLDRSYLADELSKLGLRDFEQWTRRLSFRALEDPRAACRCAQGRDAEEARRKRQRVFRMPTRRVFCA
ncbi:MAG: nucleotidyltransferase family protein [Eggerthella lenta]